MDYSGPTRQGLIQSKCEYPTVETRLQQQGGGGSEARTTSRLGVQFYDGLVLNYNARRLRSIESLLMCLVPGSAFSSWRLWRDTGWILLEAVLLSPLVYYSYYRGFSQRADSQDVVLDGLLQFMSYLHGLLPFLLGLYMSTCVSRWWDLRNSCLGGLWGAIDDLCLQLAAYLPGDGPNREARELVLRWAVLSHELVYKQAQGQEDLSDLLRGGLMLPHEFDRIRHLPSKPQVVWVWVSSYLCELAFGAESRLPYPVTVFPQLQGLCTKARGSIGEAFAYTDTQLPFRYTHFMSSIVWFHNIFQGVVSAFTLAKYYKLDDIDRCVIELLFTIGYPVVYLAILHLCEKLANPLRATHDVDFPRGAFSEYMSSECHAFFEAGSDPPYVKLGGSLPRWNQADAYVQDLDLESSQARDMVGPKRA